MALNDEGCGGRPAFLRPSAVGLVVLGGTVGTALRDRIEALVVPQAGQVPWVTFAINVSGAFLLGSLLEALALLRPGARRRALQLALGTGLLGGYTTYSTMVMEAIALGTQASAPLAVGYAMVSVLAGFLAALLAVRVTRAAVRPLRRGAR